MGTLVCFHAHPDDESITHRRHHGPSRRRRAPGGARGGHGRGHGEAPDDLEPGETLVGSAPGRDDALGRRCSAWPGASGSATRTPGMTGWEQNADPASFLQADLDEAAERLAAILREERADVLTVYDWHGNYGHPDHIRVHQVGHRAAELAGTPDVYEATLNRDACCARRHRARPAASDEWLTATIADLIETDDGRPFGTPEADSRPRST